MFFKVSTPFQFLNATRALSAASIDVSFPDSTQILKYSASSPFTNQVLAQIELFHNVQNYEQNVYVLPKTLDEEVARLHLAHVSAELETLSTQQADYINVDVSGPYKNSDYRY